MLRSCLLALFVIVLGAFGCQANARRGADSSRVAPLFVHGEGQATVGGIAGISAGFLKEQDGRQLIEAELAKAGLTFAADALTLDDVEFPVTGLAVDFGRVDTSSTFHGKLILDGWDPAHKVAYEYVSGDDYASWAVRDSGMVIYDAMSVINTRRGAGVLQNGIAKVNPPATVVVFYDPVLTSEQAMEAQQIPVEQRRLGWAQLDSLAHVISGPRLQQQAQDFVEWMKAR